MNGGRTIGAVFGVLLVLASIVFFLAQLLAFIDPAGAQASNDNDPFGSPPSRTRIAVEMLLSLAAGTFGAWLVHRSSARRSS